MLSTTEILIRIGIMVAGIIIHQLFPTNIPLIVIGILLIIAAPIQMYRNYEHRIYEDPAVTYAGEWRDFPEEKLRELLNLIPHVGSVSSGGASKYALDAGAVITFIFVGVWGTLFFGGMMAAAGVPIIVVIDIMLIIFAIYRFYGGSLKVHPVSLQADALEQFLSFQLPDGFSKKFQAHIVKDVNGDPDILNVRMQIRSNDPISGLLCLMATISRTDVKGTNYPFAYFVIVFGGTRMLYSSTRFSNDLSQIVYSSHTYNIEQNDNDGNSVFVILPKKPKYNTNAHDCAELCDIMSECCNLCKNARSEIEKLAVPCTKK